MEEKSKFARKRKKRARYSEVTRHAAKLISRCIVLDVNVISGTDGAVGPVILPRLNRDRRFPPVRKGSRNDARRAVIARVRTRAGTKAPVAAIVINDGTRRDGSCEEGEGEERKRKLSFPRRSITRRHYFLPGTKI